MTDDDVTALWGLCGALEARLDALEAALDDTREEPAWDAVWNALHAIRRYVDLAPADPTPRP